MAYVSPSNYSKEQRTFIFRKAERKKEKAERRAFKRLKAFLGSYFLSSDERRAKNYYFLNALHDIPLRVFTKTEIASAMKNATEQDGLVNFDYHRHLAWAKKSGYVKVENPGVGGLENCCSVINNETYSINDKNVDRLLKYQQPMVDRLIDQFFEKEEKCLGQTLLGYIARMFGQ